MPKLPNAVHDYEVVDPAPAFEVEFGASDGTTIALVYLEAADIRPVTAREIANVRHVA